MQLSMAIKNENMLLITFQLIMLLECRFIARIKIHFVNLIYIAAD